MRISDWSSDVCSSDLPHRLGRAVGADHRPDRQRLPGAVPGGRADEPEAVGAVGACPAADRQPWPAGRAGGAVLRAGVPHHGPRLRRGGEDRKSTRLNSVTNAHLVCRLLLENKNKKRHKKTSIHNIYDINNTNEDLST